MTPFGEKLRELRAERGMTQNELAKELAISAPYLSALEHGRRGRPAPGLVMQICGIFGLIWDQAEELKRLAEVSHPRITIDTAGLTPKATKLANKLSKDIRNIDEKTLDKILSLIEQNLHRKKGSKHS